MMVLDPLSSPHRRSQNLGFLTSSSKKLGSWSFLLERHKFLLTMLALLAFLCTIYLYFAVTLGGGAGSCPGMSAAEKALCQAEVSLHNGKLKFF